LDAAEAKKVMRRNALRIFLILVLPLVLMACERAPAELQLVQEQRAGDFVVSLLSTSAEMQQDSNDIVLEFRDTSTNELTPVDNVRVQATMPMPGMAPMFGDTSSPVSDVPGHYEFTTDLTMAGGWNLIVTFDPGGQVQFNVNAR
jgi:hypothetical protein